MSEQPTVDIDTMPAGREMDVLVAKYVTGTLPMDGPDDGVLYTTPILWHPDGTHGAQVVRLSPAYSTDIESAWQLAHYLCTQRNLYIKVVSGQHHYPGAPSWAEFRSIYDDGSPSYGASAGVHEEALAICRAALKVAAEITTNSTIAPAK